MCVCGLVALYHYTIKPHGLIDFLNFNKIQDPRLETKLRLHAKRTITFLLILRTKN